MSVEQSLKQSQNGMSVCGTKLKTDKNATSVGQISKQIKIQYLCLKYYFRKTKRSDKRLWKDVQIQKHL